MKILHIMTHFSVSSGVARLVSSMIPILVKQGHEVDVVVLSDRLYSYRSRIEKVGSRYISLGKENSFIYNPHYIFLLASLLKNYDIVHVHQFPSTYYAVIARIISNAKCRLVLTEHSTLNNRQGKWYLKSIEKFIYHQYDRIVAISEAVKDNLYQFVDRRLIVSVVYNGISIDDFKSAQPILRTKLGVPENARLLIQVARFNPQKDQLTLIKALSQLPSNYHVIFVGDGETLSIHQQKAIELGVENRAHFLGIRTDIPALINSSDIFVLSTNFEGFGLAAVEGMAVGKPVIASNVPGLREVVEGAGVLFPVGDDKCLANEIERLFNDNAYRNVVIGKCQQRAQRYDVKIMTENYFLIYK